MTNKHIFWVSSRQLPDAYQTKGFRCIHISTHEALLDHCKVTSPDLVVLDAHDNIKKSFQIYEELRQNFPHIKISMMFDQEFDPESIWNAILKMVHTDPKDQTFEQPSSSA